MKEKKKKKNAGLYASKWGISDFYEEAEKDLREALASGEDFDTGWFGCKKEINYARIVRENEKITVSVTCNMDDLWEQDDLIYDALWEVAKIEKELPEMIIDSIRDIACDEQIEDNCTESISLPASATFDDVVGALDSCEAIAGGNNTGMYKRLCEIVYEHVEYMKENGIGFVDDAEERQ